MEQRESCLVIRTERDCAYWWTPGRMDEKHDQVSRRRDVSCQLGPTSDDFKASSAEESQAPLLTHPHRSSTFDSTTFKSGPAENFCEFM